MPIMTLDDVEEVVVPKFRTQAELQTSTIFDKELDIEKIKYQVDGLPWEVNYFNQILGVNSQPTAPDINIPATTLKYNRISNLVIYLDSGLPVSNVNDITGEAIVNAGFLPYTGDAFTATLSGGRIGVFVIQEVTKEYYNTHDIYKVEFKLISFLDTSPAVYNDLEYKTVRQYVYDKNNIDTFSNPVLLANDYKRKLDLQHEPVKILDYYIETFKDNDTKFLKLPTIGSTYIDQYVANAIFTVSSVHDTPALAKISRLPIKDNVVTVWDALLERSLDKFEIATPDLGYGITNVGNSVSNKLVSYLGIEYTITNTSNVVIIPNLLDNPLMTKKTVEVPITNRDDKYIFSNSFYTQDPLVVFSKFETLVLQYLRDEIPNRDILEEVLTEYKYWSYLDQYNLLPMLIIIVKTLINNNYSSI